MFTESHSITLVKPAKRALRDKVIHSNQTALIASVVNKSVKVRGWDINPDHQESGVSWIQTPAEDGDGYIYTIFLTMTFGREDGKRPESHELAALLRTLSKRSNSPAYGSWSLATVDGKAYFEPSDDGEEMLPNSDIIGYAEVDIPDDWDDRFSHLFGLDAHISRIKRAIIAGDRSEWANRFHCSLVGPPGCGKSDICRTIKNALGEDAVMEFDATATTAAGAIKELSEREILPRVLIVEEIEKADEKSLAFLLALCDLRGEIRKTTARQQIQRDTKVFVIATVNNFELFEKMAAGALASRFANKIHFNRPSRDQLAMILTREVLKVNGDTEWIAPTLDYCDEYEITDPRMVISLCLSGAEAWLTGEFVAELKATAAPEK